MTIFALALELLQKLTVNEWLAEMVRLYIQYLLCMYIGYPTAIIGRLSTLDEYGRLARNGDESVLCLFWLRKKTIEKHQSYRTKVNN